MSPDKASLIASYMTPDNPDVIRACIADLHRDRASWRYQLFASRWRKEADRCLIERLKARLAP